MRVIFSCGEIFFEGVLNQSKTAKAILNRLPITSQVNRWGDEIYFDVDLSLPPEHPTRTVKIGDIAYWPEGSSLCVFFGKTPISTNESPRPASEVNVVGTTRVEPNLLRKIPPGKSISLERL